MIDQRSFYVMVSRARESVTLVTDDAARLVSGIAERAGEQRTAVENDASQGHSVKRGLALG